MKRTGILAVCFILSTMSAVVAAESGNSPAGPGVAVSGHKDVLGRVFSGREKLTVKIIDEKTKQPVKGARVEIGDSDSEWNYPRGFSAIAATGEDGLCAFSNLSPDFYSVMVSAAGYAAERFNTRAPAENNEVLEKDLSPGVRLRGSLRNGSGAAVSGAAVTLISEKDLDENACPMMGKSWLFFRSDENGKFEIYVSPGNYCLWVEARGYMPGVEKSIVVKENTDAGAIELKPGRVVTVQVRNALGKPSPGVAVEAAGVETWPFPPMTDGAGGYADEKGAYVFRELRKDAKYYIRCIRKMSSVGGASLDGNTSSVEIILDEGYAIRGRLLEKGTGKPISGDAKSAQVTVEWATPKGTKNNMVHPNPDMTYEINVPTLKGLKVVGYSDHYCGQAVVEIPAPAENAVSLNVDLFFDIGLSLKVSVIDAATGKPVSDVAIKSSPRGGTNKSDNNGEATITGLEPRDICIEIESAAGYVTCGRYIVTVSKDSSEPFVIKLERGGSMSGVVLGPDGNPVKGVKLFLEGDSSKGDFVIKVCETRLGGAFEFKDLPPMPSFKIQVDKPGFPTRVIEYKDFVKGENRTGVEIRLELGGVCEATVQDFESKPAAGVWIELLRFTREGGTESASAGKRIPIGSNGSSGQTDVSGRVVMRDLEPGWYLVKLRKQGYPEMEKEIEVQTGKTAAVAFQLPKVEIFSGKVVDENGKPVPHADVRVDPMPGDNERRCLMTHCKPDGTFEIPGVKPGLVKVSAYQSGYAEFVKENVETAGVRDFVIVMVRNGSLAGKIKTSGGITEFYVYLFTSTSQNPDDQFRYSAKVGVFRSPEGKFLLEDVRAGAYRVVVLCKGYARTLHPEPVVVKNREQTSGLEIEAAARGGALEIAVSDEEGAPVKDAALLLKWKYWSSERNESVQELTLDSRISSDAEGRLWARNLPAGAYNFTVEHRDFKTSEKQEIEISEGEKREIKITLVKK